MRLNKTAQRAAILEELRSVTCHPTADELYTMLRKKMPQISLGTVYRNLEQLSELGIIQKISTSGTQKRFDGNVEFHHHMRCRECGRVVDMDDPALAELNEAFARVLPRVQCEGFRLEFVGHCQECRANAGLNGEKDSCTL